MSCSSLRGAQASLAPFLVLVVSLASVRCGDDRVQAFQPPEQHLPDASPGRDSGSPQNPHVDASAAVRDGGWDGGYTGLIDASDPDLQNPFPSLLSNTPGVRVQQKAPVTFRYLRPTSSYVEWLPSGYRRWFAEIKNGNRTAWCHPEVEVSLLGADSAVLWTSEGYVEAESYQDGDSVLPVPCVGPNETAVVWAIEIEPESSFQIEAVQVIRLRLEGENLPDAVPHPAAPRVDSAEVETIPMDGGTEALVTGVLIGQSQPVSDVAVEVFAKNAAGQIFEVLRAVRDQDVEGVLDVGARWEFTTPGIAQPIANFRLTTEFSP
jgi:hypothetical protein